MHAVFRCPIPPTLNEQIRFARSHWAISSKEKARWTQDIATRAIALPRFPGAVWLDFLWLVSSRNRDPDNIQASAKYVMDGLVLAGVLKGDSLMIVQSPVVHRFDRGRNQLALTISSEPIYLELQARLKKFNCKDFDHAAIDRFNPC